MEFKGETGFNSSPLTRGALFRAEKRLLDQHKVKEYEFPSLPPSLKKLLLFGPIVQQEKWKLYPRMIIKDETDFRRLKAKGKKMKSFAKKECSNTLRDCLRKQQSSEKQCHYENRVYQSGQELETGARQPRICADGDWVKPTEVKVPGILVE